jgi:high-affinity K+ transport system ATPase subunit B
LRKRPRDRTPGEIALGVCSMTFVFLSPSARCAIAQLNSRADGVIDDLARRPRAHGLPYPTTIGALLSAIGIGGIDH